MMELLDKIPWSLAVFGCLTLGLAPFFPEPHIWEKLKMLGGGSLQKPVDIFDLCFYAAPWLLLFAKLARMAMAK
ncbi:RND transporter [Hyphomonas sp.]|uniref:RND transporter n=1 Tax=Hyphomonas sp. TaxID=87 RepID=UPI003527AACB